MDEMIRIVTDSSCDLPSDILEEFKIEIVPLSVLFGTDIYNDGELSVDEFWAKASAPTIPEPPSHLWVPSRRRLSGWWLADARCCA